MSMHRSVGGVVFLSLALPAAASAQGAHNVTWFGPGHVTVQSLAVSPDGQTLATASFEDDTIKLWRTSDGAFLRTLAGHYAGIFSVAFSPDGQFLAAGGEQAFGSGQSTVLLWIVANGTIVRQSALSSKNTLT